MKKNLYAEYIKEREQMELIENDLGFLSYKIFGKECYLADMYIVPESRGSKAFSYFIGELEKIAIAAGCTHISAKIYLSFPNSTRNLRAGFKLGFNLISADHGVLVIAKEVKNG